MSAAPVLPTPAADLILVLTRDIFELRGKVSSDKQLFAIQYIVASTLGKPRKPRSAPPRYTALTHAAIARKSGCSVRQIVDILADASKRGLIEVLDPAEAKKQGLGTPTHPQANWYGACPERWAAAEKYTPPKPILMPDPDVDADVDPEADTTTAVVEVAPDQPLMILPGEKSRPVPWVSSAKKYAFDCSGLTRPLSILPVLGVGVLRFRISECNQPLAANSQDAKRRRNGEPPMNPSSQVISRGGGDLAELAAAVGRYCQDPDPDAIPLLLRACRKVAPDCTPSEIAHFVDVKGPRAAKAETAIGFLVNAVPPCLTKEALQKFRRFHADAMRQANAAAANAQRNYAAMILEAEADDPLVTKEDRLWAKQILKG